MIELVREGELFILTMNDGENRWNTTFVRAFASALDEVEASSGPAALVTRSSNEKFFSNGLDLDWISTREEHVGGVLIVEAMAQVGGMLLMGAVPDPANKVVYFTSLNNVKWRKPVKPGDQLRMELEMLQVRGMMCRMQGVAKVDGEVVCEAEMSAMVRDR